MSSTHDTDWNYCSSNGHLFNKSNDVLGQQNSQYLQIGCAVVFFLNKLINYKNNTENYAKHISNKTINQGRHFLGTLNKNHFTELIRH